MNRSILIVICDFLLVSLLVFSSVDINNVAQEGTTRSIANINTGTNQPSGGSDLTAAMRTALEEERQKRESLTGELARTREAAQTSEEKAAQLQRERSSLEQQYTVAQTNLQNLSEQLKANSAQATISNEKLLALQAELERRAEQAAALQQQLNQLSQSNRFVSAEQQRLANQLEVAEVEKRSARELASAMQEQVKAERAEKAKLVAGVQALATNSSQLVREIRENRPMAANAIYSDYVTNRVQMNFTATRPGLFGGKSAKRSDAKTVLVTEGGKTFALSHVEDTPLEFWTPGIEWSDLTGVLIRNGAQINLQSLSFSLQDPRVVYMPISASEAEQLGGKIYRTSDDPYKFQDAVLVGTREDYYGECKFEIDTSTPGYVRLDRSVLRGLFGKFNPSRGDLVLSKQGELLGVMANSTYCLMLRGFAAIATLEFGDIRQQHTGALLSALHNTVLRMPEKLE